MRSKVSVTGLRPNTMEMKGTAMKPAHRRAQQQQGVTVDDCAGYIL
jgi:hypothetical protein